MDLLTTLAQLGEHNYGMPPQASTYAADVDWTYVLTYWSCVVAFVIIMVATILFIIKYRHREGYKQTAAPAHSTFLELFWSIIPTGIFLVIFYYGFTGFVDMTTAPDYAYEIRVRAFKWGWEFSYPTGAQSAQLVIPKDTPVRLILTSDDVIHSLFIPAFRAKKDVVPGRYNWTWFEAIANPPTRPKSLTDAGKLADAEYGLDYFDLYCAEYCGTNHSLMRSRVYVLEPAAFTQWTQDKAQWVRKMLPADAGAKLFIDKGCNSCHTLDGSASNGPTWQDLFGNMQPMVDGQAVMADENYIRESILDPGAKLHAGFANVMPAFQGNITEDEITAIIEYMKTISDKGPKPMDAWPELPGESAPPVPAAVE